MEATNSSKLCVNMIYFLPKLDWSETHLQNPTDRKKSKNLLTYF